MAISSTAVALFVISLFTFIGRFLYVVATLDINIENIEERHQQILVPLYEDMLSSNSAVEQGLELRGLRNMESQTKKINSTQDSQ